jgi:type I restriction enzyme S subunit
VTQESASTIEQDLAEAISSVSKLRRDDYPSDWQIVKLGEIIDIQGGSQPPKDQFIYEPREGYVRLLQIRDFGDKPVPTYVSKDKVTKFCNKEDIFIARYGASLGRIVTNMEGAYNVALAKVIFDCAVVFPRYMFYLLQTPYFQTPIHMISRSAQNGFNKGEIFPIELPLAPLQSQKRIVAEIEKQFSRLDEAVANLKRVKANLKRYKASVLKAAVEGRLVPTEAELASREGRSFETGGQLLHRTLDARRSMWNGKLTMPPGPIVSDLPELPAGWIWVSAVQACDPVIDCHNKTAPYINDGIPLVRTTNIRDGRLVLEDLRYVDQPTYEYWSRRCPPQHGDVLFTREAPMGEAGIIPPGLQLCLGQRTMLMRPSLAISAGFLLASLMSPVVKGLIDRVAVGSGVKHLRVGDVERLPIPLPPLVEQHRIVAEVERLLSVIEELEAAVEANLTRADRLRQSILSQAFAGCLLSGRSNET